jgi:endonuclease YncB( thermonuclease family)
MEHLKLSCRVGIGLRAILAAVGISVAAAASADEIIGLARVVDGDTVEVNAVKIRLEAIDAPETEQLCLNEQSKRWTCGIEVREQLKEHAGHKLWTCHRHGADRFGRVLASCEVEGEDIQGWLVTNGWALAFTRYSHKYDREQEAARIARRGLWSGAFIAPWNWRHRTSSTEILGSTSVPIDAQSILVSASSATGR